MAISIDKNSFNQFVQSIISKHKDESLFLPVDEKEIHRLYEKGYFSYQSGNLKESISTFQTLVFHRPYEPIYWNSLASALHQAQDFELSLQAFAMVALLKPEDPSCHYYAAECYFSLNNPKEGMIALREAKRKMDPNDPLQGRLELLKIIWQGVDNA